MLPRRPCRLCGLPPLSGRQISGDRSRSPLSAAAAHFPSDPPFAPSTRHFLGSVPAMTDIHGPALSASNPSARERPPRNRLHSQRNSCHRVRSANTQPHPERTHPRQLATRLVAPSWHLHPFLFRHPTIPPIFLFLRNRPEPDSTLDRRL